VKRVAGPVDWDHEWDVVWKADATNPWFRYQADTYATWLAADVPGARILKTDAFDEACGFRPVGGQGRLFLMDMAPRILGEALRRRPDLPGCATDVRRLAFRDGAFDLVFSPSTLDHFDDERDIDIALAELGRVLRPGGRLVVTLDNPANPILRMRQAVHRRTGPLGALSPYRIGRTLPLAGLVAAAERAGLDVVARGWAVHAPRIVGLWLGEWAARRRSRMAGGLGWLFGRIERVAGRFPTRQLTGHFVVAVCRRPVGPLPPTRAAPRGLVAVGVVVWKQLEHRLRSAYLRRVPAPVLDVVDPPLRRAVSVGRRAAAVPIYLRQHLALWSGSCAGGTARVAVWGKPDAPRRLFDIVFDGAPAPEWQGARLLPQVLGSPELDADLLIAETTPALAPAFRRRGFLVVPAMVRFAASIEELRAVSARPSESLVSDLRRVTRAAYRTEVWSYDRELSRRFYDDYIIPHALARFGEETWLSEFAWIDRQLRAGMALVVLSPGRSDPDAMLVLVPRGRVLVLASLGTRGGDPAIARAGAIHALYKGAIDVAAARGLRLVDAGRCRPWRDDGVAVYKWKRGFRPIVDGAQTLEYAVRLLRPASPAARRLGEHGLFVRVGRRFLVLGPDGRLSEP
jgi:SAM-dependent methyltransferase